MAFAVFAIMLPAYFNRSAFLKLLLGVFCGLGLE
jgi:hypothetical protein